MNEQILIKNIYYMLAYAFRVLEQAEYKELRGEEFENIHNLFAAILSKGIAKQVKQGLYKEYVSYRDALKTLRGRISILETLKRQKFKDLSLVCEYDELTEDNLFNQVLKSTCYLLLNQQDVEEKYKSSLKQSLIYFSRVSDIDLRRIPWRDIDQKRKSESYRMLLAICRLIIDGLLISEEEGKEKLNKFIDDQSMARLFENFVLEYYKRHHAEYRPKASQIQWALDDPKQDSLLPTMNTDVCLRQGKKILIIDCKFYSRNTQEHYGKRTIRSENLYQIFTYVKNLKEQSQNKGYEVSGLLLYAKTVDDVQAEGNYLMSGNKISVKTLGLKQEFRKISAALDCIAYEEFKKQHGH